MVQIAVLLALIPGAAAPSFSQTTPNLQTYFKDYIRLSDDQIAVIRSGRAVAKTLPSRIPDEIFVFGAIYINAPPESYLKFSHDFDRLRKMSGYLAIGEFSNPPRLSDLKDFKFDTEDIKDLKNCKPGDCEIQMPASAIEEVHRLVNWSDPNAEAEVDQLLQQKVIDRVLAYQRDGNSVLGIYNDRRNPTQVPQQFKYMLSYSRALPRYLPDFYNYLLTYPSGRPENMEDSFYWAKVKFGLKPTLRVIHVVTMRGENPAEPAYAIAEKQLYSSHYFQTALDLTFCVRDASGPNATGFYLIKTMGSEQAGLTGFKGSILRKVATDRSASSLEKSLATIKNLLER